MNRILRTGGVAAADRAAGRRAHRLPGRRRARRVGRAASAWASRCRFFAVTVVVALATARTRHDQHAGSGRVASWIVKMAVLIVVAGVPARRRLLLAARCCSSRCSIGTIGYLIIEARVVGDHPGALPRGRSLVTAAGRSARCRWTTEPRPPRRERPRPPSIRLPMHPALSSARRGDRVVRTGIPAGRTGGLGWHRESCADHVLGTGRIFLVIGLVVGAVTGMWIVYVRFGQDDTGTPRPDVGRTISTEGLDVLNATAAMLAAHADVRRSATASGFHAPTIEEFFPPQLVGEGTWWGPTRINLIMLLATLASASSSARPSASPSSSRRSAEHRRDGGRRRVRPSRSTRSWASAGAGSLPCWSPCSS